MKVTWAFFISTVEYAVRGVSIAIALFDKYAFCESSKDQFVSRCSKAFQSAVELEMQLKEQLCATPEEKAALRTEWERSSRSQAEQLFERLLFYSMVYTIFSTPVEKNEGKDEKKSVSYVSVVFRTLFMRQFDPDNSKED